MKAKTPTIREIRALLIGLKPGICDEDRAYEGDDSDTPSMLVTIGCNNKGNWSYQTGDTSFTGGAYGFPHWGQWALTRRCNCTEAARHIINELKESQTYET